MSQEESELCEGPEVQGLIGSEESGQAGDHQRKASRSWDLSG